MNHILTRGYDIKDRLDILPLVIYFRAKHESASLRYY